jgi:small subunit ribosomal protein S18
MGRKSKSAPSARTERKGKDNGKKFKKKICLFCKEGVTWIDYKDVNLLRRFMSDRAKIRARRVSGNCAQHQRDIAMAIKTSRELALLPYATRVTSSRGGGRGGGGRGRDDRGPREDRGPRPEGAGAGGPQVGDRALPGEVPEERTLDEVLPEVEGAAFEPSGDAVEAEA